MNLLGILLLGVLTTVTVCTARPTPYFYKEYSSEEDELNDYDDSYEEENIKFIDEQPAKEKIEDKQTEIIESLDKNKVKDILNNQQLSPAERFSALAQLALDQFSEIDGKDKEETNDQINIVIEEQQGDNNEDNETAGDSGKLNIKKIEAADELAKDNKQNENENLSKKVEPKENEVAKEANI